MNSNSSKPPRLALRFLRLFLRKDLAEEVEGDLEEQYYSKQVEFTPFKARLDYWYQVMRYIRPFAIKQLKSKNSIQIDMFQNYFKIGYRNLFKNKSFALINVGGLAMGMTVAMLIGLWIYDELSYNHYFKNRDRIAQVMRHESHENESFTSEAQVRALGPYLKSEYEAYFKDVVRIRARLEEHVLALNDIKFTQTGYYIDPGGPEMFSLDMIEGNYDCLNDKNSIILSSSLAEKLFKGKEAMGQVIQMDAEDDLVVTGVYKDLPSNNTFSEATYFSAMEKYISYFTPDDEWGNQHMYIYVQLRESADLEEASHLIENIFENIYGNLFNNEHNLSIPDLFLHPMNSWHLYGEFENGKPIISNKLKFVWFYGIIGVFVLLLSCINFMNLSTARSIKRAREVGIRKSIGSTFGQLIFQFLSESLVIVLLALTLSILAVQAFLPVFNEMSGKDMSIPYLNVGFWGITLLFVVITTLLAGSYPALYLSSLDPVNVLKGKLVSGNNSGLLRKALVIFQFTVSIVLITGTILVEKQIQFVKDRPVGYSKEGLITFRPRSPEYFGKYDVLRQELLNTGVISEMAESNYPITSTLGNNGGFNWEGKNPDFNPSFNTIRVTHEYGKTIGWEFLMGRDFSRNFNSDKNGIIITESALELMNIDQPIGKTIEWDPGYREAADYVILGVVKDMIKGSPYEKPREAIMFLSEKDERWLFIRMRPDVSPSEALPKIHSAFNQVIPSAPFEYEFVDELYGEKFKSEEQVGKIAAFLASLAIAISCLGLIGLTSYLTEQRTKEIGIRKILGASIIQIWKLLSSEHIVLVIFSCLLSIPIGYHLMNNWLLKYEYRIDLDWWLFAASGMGSLLIVLTLVSIHALKSAFSNPVKALRVE